jgi:hypothetical protein
MKSITKHAVSLSIVLSALSFVGCASLTSGRDRQESAKARMRATNLAEAEGKRTLEAIDSELDRQLKQAEEVEKTNPRAGCKLTAEARNKACVDRNAFYTKSTLSTFRSRVDPERCKTDFESSMKTCAKLPETN